MNITIIPRRLRTLAAELRRSTSGLALIEFGMSLPVLLALGLYGLETANLALAHLKVSNIAMIAADGAGRVRDSIDETDIEELFIGAKKSGEAMDFAANGRIIVSDLEQTSDGKFQWIRWQRCTGTKKADSSWGTPLDKTGAAITNGTEAYKTDGSLSSNPSSELKSTLLGMGPATNRIASQPGTSVLVAEVVYDYQPLISNSLLGAKTIRYTSAFNVRQRTNQVLSNLSKMAPYSCNKYAA
jgi:Flp pilus assembly protein TadG